MTKIVETPITRYTGNGATEAFNAGFHAFSLDDIDVQLLDDDDFEIDIDRDGMEAYDYELTGTFDAPSSRYTTVTVTFNTAPPTGYQVGISRSDAQDQTFTGSTGQPLDIDALETELDQMVGMIQDVKAQVDRAPLRPLATDTIIDFGGSRGVNAADPINDGDLVTKQYLDELVGEDSGEDAGNLLYTDRIMSRTRTVASRLDDRVSIFAGLTDQQITAAINRTFSIGMSEGIQSVLDGVSALGGGTVWFPMGLYAADAKIVIPQGVLVEGEGNGYGYLYSSDDFLTYSSAIGAVPGLNDHVFQATYVPLVGGMPNVPDEVRHEGGIARMAIWGNRSADQNPEVRNLNTAGCGLHVWGISGFKLEDVLLLRCAEEGVRINSRDYGAGTVSTNNMKWGRVKALGNYASGFNVSGGDHEFAGLVAGYNGLHGIISSSGNSLHYGMQAWNNVSHGIVMASAVRCALNASRGYDNGSNGIHITGVTELQASGLMASGNGTDTGLAASSRCGVLVGSDCEGVSIDGVMAIADATQQYGGYINNTTHPVSISNFTADTHPVEDLYIADRTNLNTTSYPRVQEAGVAIVSTDFVGAVMDGATDDQAIISAAIGTHDNLFVAKASHALDGPVVIGDNEQLTGLIAGHKLIAINPIGSGDRMISMQGEGGRVFGLELELPSGLTNQARGIMIRGASVAPATSDPAVDNVVLLSRLVSRKAGAYPIHMARDVLNATVIGVDLYSRTQMILWKPNITDPDSDDYQGYGLLVALSRGRGADSSGGSMVALDGNLVGGVVIGNMGYDIQDESGANGFGVSIANEGQNPLKMAAVAVIGNHYRGTEREVYHVEDANYQLAFVGNTGVDAERLFLIINSKEILDPEDPDSSPNNTLWSPKQLLLLGNAGHDFLNDGLAIGGASGGLEDGIIAFQMIGRWAQSVADGTGLLVANSLSTRYMVVGCIVRDTEGASANAIEVTGTKIRIALNNAQAPNGSALALIGTHDATTFIESNNLFDGDVDVEDTGLNNATGDMNAYKTITMAAGVQDHLLFYTRRKAKIVRIDFFNDEAANGSTPLVFDIGFGGGAEIMSNRNFPTGTAQHAVSNYPTFVSRDVPADSAVTLHMEAGSNSTYRGTLKVNYFEYD